MYQYLFAMSKGRPGPEQTLEDSSYCVFYTPAQPGAVADCIEMEQDQMTLRLQYGDAQSPSPLIISQQGSNVVISEPETREFCSFLQAKGPKHLGHILMYALQFKIQRLSVLVEASTQQMKQLEDELDSCLDNSGTYRLLDFRRSYTEYGNQVIAVKEILTRIDKGYYPLQMQNSYVLQGEVMLEFRFLEERYELIKNTVIKDFDTYTSIINNNINRNARLLSVISLIGVVLNFMFGGLLAFNPVLGVAGGVVIAGLSVAATATYHINKRMPKPPRHHGEAVEQNRS